MQINAAYELRVSIGDDLDIGSLKLSEVSGFLNHIHDIFYIILGRFTSRKPSLVGVQAAVVVNAEVESG